MKEVWKEIDGYEGYYEVSNLGRVRSVDRWITDSKGHEYYKHGKLRAFVIDKFGYPTVNLYKDGGQRVVAVHILVAHAFVKGWFEDAEVNHKDFDRSNACASNLEWVSHIDNVGYSHAAGHYASGCKNGRAIQVKLIDDKGKTYLFGTIRECAKYVIAERDLPFKLKSVEVKLSKYINTNSMYYGFEIQAA